MANHQVAYKPALKHLYSCSDGDLIEFGVKTSDGQFFMATFRKGESLQVVAESLRSIADGLDISTGLHDIENSAE